MDATICRAVSRIQAMPRPSCAEPTWHTIACKPYTADYVTTVWRPSHCRHIICKCTMFKRWCTKHRLRTEDTACFLSLLLLLARWLPLAQTRCRSSKGILPPFWSSGCVFDISSHPGRYNLRLRTSWALPHSVQNRDNGVKRTPPPGKV